VSRREEPANEKHLDFAKAGGIDLICRQYRSVVVALYPDAETARVVAERLIESGIPARDISVVVSDGDLRKSLDRGESIIPPAEVRGVERAGAVTGALWGGTAGLVLGAEILLLGTGAGFVLPVLAGVALIGVALGSSLDATFHEMDLGTEGVDYRMHLHHGGALLAVYAKDDRAADTAEAVLQETQPAEIGRHPLAAPSHPSPG
jgi:hypothetical protein